MLRQKPDREKILEALNLVKQEGYLIYVRPTGELVGLCPPDYIQTYHDEQYDLNRKRVKYWHLDGEKDLDTKDGVNKKKGNVIDLMKIEISGGLALTELTEDGDRKPVYTGRQAQEIMQKDEDVEALAKELNRLGDDYKTKKERLSNLQKKVTNLKDEKDELTEDREYFRDANEQLQKRKEALKARLNAKEARIEEVERELEAFKKSHKDLADEMKSILEKVEDARSKKLTASDVDGELGENLKKELGGRKTVEATPEGGNNGS